MIRTPSVRLQQFVPHLERLQIELNMILEAFNILLRTSADAALDQVPSIYTFQEKCLYLGTIHEDSVNNLGRGYEQTADAFHDGRTSNDSDPAQVGSASQSRWSTEPYAGSSADWHSDSLVGPNANGRENGTTSSAWEDNAMDDIYVGPSLPNLPSHSTKTFVGIIYFLPHPQYPSEVSLGLALLPDHCNRGIGPRAVLQALEMAFDQFAFHRVSATIVDGPTREHAIRMFVALGFAYEGVRRRAIMSAGPGQNENTWRDVHHLGLLDTDWAVYGGAQAILNILDSSAGISDTGNNEEAGKAKAKAKAKRTRWDEMFVRHQCEREELIGFDERHKALKRTLSTETLRPPTTAADSSAEASSASEAESDIESVRSGYGRRSVSPAFSATTNPFASPADYSSSTQLLHRSATDPLLSDAGFARSPAESMVAAWRTLSFAASDAYTHSDMESDSEMHALLPRRTRRRSMRRTNSSCGSLVSEMSVIQSMHFPSPPPQSDAESYISESEVDRYASCEEEEADENDVNGAVPNVHSSSAVISRLASGLETLSPSEAPEPFEGLLASPHVAKRRRTCEFVAAATSLPISGREQPSTAIPTSATPSGDSQLQATSVIDSSSILQSPRGFTVPVPPPIVPSLSYRLREREILGAHAMDTDADLEGTWDLLSTTSESESSVSSSSSLSLQSASDSE